MFIFALPFLGLIKKRTLWTSLSMMLTACGLLLCALPFLLRDRADYVGGWATHGAGDSLCGAQTGEEDCDKHAVRDTQGMVLVFVGFFISGIGSSFFHSFGIPYIDDNINKNQSPAFLGLIYASRTLGPGLGAIVGR